MALNNLCCCVVKKLLTHSLTTVSPAKTGLGQTRVAPS